ncbi:MAG: tetratricopeptide repeat protein [Spirochaetales bacterium]|nr:tetratricopeptide repeat protein [Spirochaetales bacterium]
MNTVKETEMTSAEKAAMTLKNNKKYFVMAGIALLLILAAIGTVEYFGNQKEERSVVLAEDIDAEYQDYMTAAEDDKAAVKENLMTLIDEAKADYSGLYAEMRALNTEALLYADEEKWSDAAALFTALADGFSDSYIAPVSLINAAAMKEEEGDAEASAALLQRVLAEYKDVSADIPEVIFNLGRLSESMADSQKAIEYYEMISSDYSSSSWTNLAKSRIIALKAGS